MRLSFPVYLFLLALLTSREWAAEPDPTTSRSLAAPPPRSELADEKEQPFATGDWGGLRTKLKENGLELTGSYSGACFGVVSGGIDQGVIFNGWLQFGADLRLEKLLGWQGAHLHASFVDPHGANGSTTYAGDLAGFSGIQAYNSPRLYEVWFEQNLWKDRVSLRIGQMAFEEEFFLTESSAYFQNSGFTSSVALVGDMPIPSSPDSTLGIRLRLEPTPGLIIQAAVFDGNPSPGNYPDRTPGAAPSNEFNHHNVHWALRRDEGLLWLGEIGGSFNQPKKDEEEEPKKEKRDGKTAREGKETQPPRGLAGSYKVGAVYHSDTFSDIYDATLTSLGSSLAPDEIRRGGRNYAVYTVVQQELWREPGTDNEGLTAFFRGTWLPRNRNFLEYEAIGGLSYKGLFPGRSDDRLGLGFAHYSVSDGVIAATHNTNVADHTHYARPDYERVIEATYCVQLTKWLTIQPDFQYIIHPGGSREIDNAVVVGFISTFTF